MKKYRFLEKAFKVKKEYDRQIKHFHEGGEFEDKEVQKFVDEKLGDGYRSDERVIDFLPRVRAT